MPYSKSNKEIQEAHMGGVGKYKSPATYTPYKMVGHTLPGIKQRSGAKMRSFGTKDSDMPDKVSQKSGLLYSEGGVGSSPAKGFWDKVKSLGKKALDPLGLKKKADKALGINQKAEVAGGGGADHTHPEFAQLDEAMQGGGMQKQSVNPAMVGEGAGMSGFGLGGVGDALAKSKAQGSMFGGIGSI